VRVIATDGNAPPDKHDAYAALRERNYRFFAGGWVLACAGLQMQGTALGWEIYERTGDALALGLVGLARALPVLVLALPAGQIVDMLDRRKVLIFTQIAFAGASVLLTLGSMHEVGVVWMYVLIALTGCARVFNGPSRSSLLPLIVKPENFHSAVTWNSGVFQLAATLGPILAGTVIWASGAAWPVYLIAGVSCLWFAGACVFIRPHREQARSNGRNGRNGPRPRGLRGLWSVVRPGVLVPGMLDGVRHMWREKTVLGAISLDMFAVMLGGATALMPIFAKDILQVGPVGLGALKAAPYVGALVMALVMAHRRPIARAGPALLWSVAWFGVFTIVFGFSENFVLSMAMLLALGAVDNISVVIRHTLVAARTPDELRGRVSAVNSVFIESSNELGGLLSGVVAKLAGAVFSVVTGGIGTVVVVAIMAATLPELRRLGKLENPK
jgi:MFS family permease